MVRYDIDRVSINHLRRRIKMLRWIAGIMLGSILVCIVGCSVTVDPTTLDFGESETVKPVALSVQGPFAWNIICFADWVRAEPTSGPASGEVLIWFYVDRSGLTPGPYSTMCYVQLTPDGIVEKPTVDILMTVTVTTTTIPGECNGDVCGGTYERCACVTPIGLCEIGICLWSDCKCFHDLECAFLLGIAQECCPCE